MTKSVRLRRSDTFFACGKCLKRHPDGKALRRALKAGAKAADAKVVRTSCMGICPKKAVVVASRSSVALGRAVVVEDAAAVTAAFASVR